MNQRTIYLWKGTKMGYNILNRIGLHADTVQDAIERCRSIANSLNINPDSIEQEALNNLPEDLTNMIIGAFFDATKSAIEDKRDSLDLPEDSVQVEIDVNDSASQIFMDSQCLYDDEGRYVFFDAVWNKLIKEPDVKSIIEDCYSLMKEAGCGSDDCLNELDDYAKNYVQADFDFDEIDIDIVKEGFLHETAEWVEEQLQSTGKSVNITFEDNTHLYLNGKQYVPDTNMLAKESKTKDYLEKI